jgi:hypothetical protein
MRCLFNFIGGVVCSCALATTAWGGEYVLLRSGFRLHAERHEIDGSTVRIFVGGGASEVPLDSVVNFEQEEITPPLAAAQLSKTDRETFVASVSTLTPFEMAGAAAKDFHLPEAFVRSVMKVESAFHENAISPKGALGLMQLMPETASRLGVDPKNPRQNAEGGAEYLRDLLARYENDPDQVLLALAAYNAGPAAVERYHGVPPFRETREYILRVLKNWQSEQHK